jgi:hypothetical protein
MAWTPPAANTARQLESIDARPVSFVVACVRRRRKDARWRKREPIPLRGCLRSEMLLNSRTAEGANMRIESLYRIRFTYPEAWGVELESHLEGARGPLSATAGLSDAGLGVGSPVT